MKDAYTHFGKCRKSIFIIIDLFINFGQNVLYFVLHDAWVTNLLTRGTLKIPPQFIRK